MENDEEFPRMTVDEGLGHNTGQVADCSIVEVAGTTYFFYAGYTDQIGPAGNIKLAKVNKTLDQLAQARIVGQIAEV